MDDRLYAVIRSGQSNNELKHWKYIKKIKKNGKWKYYYDVKALKKDTLNALGVDEKERLDAAKKEYDKYGYDTDDVMLALERAKKRVNDVNERYANAKYYSDPNNPIIKGDDPGRVAALRKMSKTRLNELEEEARNEIQKQADGKKAIAEYAKAQQYYNKTVMGIVDNASEKISKGRDYVSKLLGIH